MTRLLRFLTAGESHGPALTVVVDGLPAGVFVRRERIDADLRRRQGGYGRGGRMKIETDTVEILGGVRHGRTLGSPVCLVIRNADHANWRDVMSPDPQGPEAVERRALSRPRPGHADLAGGLKYATPDLRDVVERASARETAARVAAGALARSLLEALAIEVRSHVVRIGGAALERTAGWEEMEAVESSPVRCIDPEVSALMIGEIDKAKAAGDSVGGAFEVVAKGVPAGLGAYAQSDRRLDGRVAQALMSIPAVKAVALGDGFRAGETPGSQFHDEILPGEGTAVRPTNRAGGLEGGVTNGEPLRATAIVKPIPTLLTPLRSVDWSTGEPASASIERSDTCVVPAAGVVGEAAICLVLADALLEKLGGDSLAEMRRHAEAWASQARVPIGSRAD